MKVTVKRKSHAGNPFNRNAEDNRWRNVSEKSSGKKVNSRAAIRTTVIPRVTRRGA